MSRLEAYKKLIRLDKPIGTLLLLWPTLTALFIASNGKLHAWILFVFVCGTFLVRSAGCIINDFFDRELDQHVERTKARPLASGEISSKHALGFCLCLFLIAFFLVLSLNKLTIIMSVIALFLACLYPLMKRFTYFPQVWLGVAFNWGVLMAFTAVLGHITLAAVLLYLSTLLFTIAYDTVYAMVDREDDLKIGIKSTAIFFGKNDRRIIFIMQMLAMALLLVVGVLLQRNVWFYFGLFAALLTIGYQYYLIKNRKPHLCFQAFLNSHWLLFFIFFGVVLSYL